MDLGTAVSNLQASNALIWSSSSNASNITAGTLANARLPGIVSVSNVNASVSMGIATTAPTANLHVVGDALVTTDLTLGSTSQFFFDESATSLYVDSSQSITGNALVVADTMYVKDNNVFVDGNVTASNIITDAIVLGAGSVSVQSISLDDVVAVNSTTSRDVTVKNMTLNSGTSTGAGVFKMQDGDGNFWQFSAPRGDSSDALLVHFYQASTSTYTPAFSVNTSGHMSFHSVPTSSSGLAAGTMWNHNGTLKIA